MSTAEKQAQELNGLSIFGTSAEDIASTVEDESYEGSSFVGFLELNPQGAADKKDSAYVKLIQNPDQQAKNILSKTSYKIVTSCATKNFMFDSAKSLGWRENDCQIVNLWDECKGDKLKEEKFKKHFQFRKPRVVLLQVLRYDSKPELVGSIMPLRITEEVEDLIKKTVKPSKEDVELNDVVANNVYDIFDGHCLLLEAGIKSIPSTTGGETKIGRDFKNSKFIKATSFKHFLVPQLDDEGNKVTKTVGEKEVVQYEKIELTADERNMYANKDYTGTLLEKLKRVLSYLNDEDTAKHVDFGYREPSEDRTKMVNGLISSFRAGEPMVINGAAEAEADADADDSETATGENENKSETSDSIAEKDLLDIVEKAEKAGE